jgi:prepilin-type N-terminal cleavage/methylation domain-containing protein
VIWMWATGKTAGFTLLEVLAVIILLGLVMTWVIPDFFQRDERIAINYIGSLLRSDLTVMIEEAGVEGIAMKMEFDDHGYCLKLPETEVVRNFKEYGFSFRIPKQEESGQDAGPIKQPEITVQADGSYNSLEINWATAHFSGGFAINGDSVETTYATGH